jgi:hypothetical protein
VFRPRSDAQYHSSLATRLALLGVALLESREDSETNMFVSGTPYIKMVEYAGFSNEYAAWKNAINELCADGWRALADERCSVRDRHSLESVIAESWRPSMRRGCNTRLTRRSSFAKSTGCEARRVTPSPALAGTCDCTSVGQTRPRLRGEGGLPCTLMRTRPS